MASFNQVKPSRTPLPHGWDSWNTKYKTDISEDKLLAALDFVDKTAQALWLEPFLD